MSLEEINRFALTYDRAVAQTLQLLTYTRNPRRNPRLWIYLMHPLLVY